MVYDDIYIQSKGEKIAITIFYKNEESKKMKKDKPCLLFLPGTMANPFTYWDFIEQMVEYDIVVLGLHFIGHGKSSRKNQYFTLDDLKQNTKDALKYVVNNLEKYGTRVDILGHSQGGILLGTLVGNIDVELEKHVGVYFLGNLIISNQSGIKKMVGLEKVPQSLVPIARFFVGLYGKIFKHKKLKFEDYVKVEKRLDGPMTEEQREDVLEEIEEVDPLKIKEYPLCMVTSLITVETDNLINPKREVNQKIVVLVADRDPIFPVETQKEAYELLPFKNKKYIEYKSDKHMIYTENPKDISKIIYDEMM